MEDEDGGGAADGGGEDRSEEEVGGDAAAAPAGMATGAGETEKASARNVVIDFLLEEHYLLTAFELYHELLEDGHAAAAVKLHSVFADAEAFPAEQMRALQSMDAQVLVKETEAASERAAVVEYELRLAREDIASLQEKLENLRQVERATVKEVSAEIVHGDGDGDAQSGDGASGGTEGGGENGGFRAGRRSFRELKPLGDVERRDLSCAVKQYLVGAGYKLTAMTLREEVDEDLDDWPDRVPDALRRYYLSFLSSSSDAVEERAALQEERAALQAENASLGKEKEALEAENAAAVRALETARRDAKEKDRQLRQLKESLGLAERQVNEFRAEVTSLKFELESLNSNRNGEARNSVELLVSAGGDMERGPRTEPSDDPLATCEEMEESSVSVATAGVPVVMAKSEGGTVEEMVSATMNGYTAAVVDGEGDGGGGGSGGIDSMLTREELAQGGRECEEEAERREQKGQDTVEILAEALPKIVPYVLINYREELLPLIICAIERHPVDSVRDVLTHTLFNLIKRPDEKQRRVIMDACVALARNVGEERTETELLPQCWEQIDHKYEERRILVAQSCGELGGFVRAEMRPSLILSIVQQLLEDEAGVVREAAACNLALLLPQFPNLDKFFKVEEMIFVLVCDSAESVVEASLARLIPAVVAWAGHEKQLVSHLVSAVLSRLLGSVQRCPHVSTDQDSVEFQLRILGERERWVVDALLRTLISLLPEVRRIAFRSCPFPDISFEEEEDLVAFFSEELLKLYARANVEWPDFDWLPEDCFPALLHVSTMLPPKEEGLRTRLSVLLRTVGELFGVTYLMTIVLPIFLMAAGDFADTSHLSSRLANRIKGFKPLTPKAELLARTCVLPLLLAGVLGAPTMPDGYLGNYLRDLVLQSSLNHGSWTTLHTPELIDAVRFLCTFQEHLDVIVGVLWDLVVNPNATVKATAAVLFKVFAPYVDLKLATQQVLPALVTLGSDTNLDVRYASIDAFGTVAQHFKDDAVVEKIRVQMDAFLDDDGSHEATIAVIRALAAAVPLTTSSLRDYLLQKLVVLSGATNLSTNLARRREKVDAFCEAIRALDATDLSPSSVKDLLLPAIQNLLKDMDALDPAHKEALEVIVRERAGGLRLDLLSKHLKKGASIGGLFGEGGYLGTSSGTSVSQTLPEESMTSPAAPPSQPEGRLKFWRTLRGTPSET